MDNYLLTNEIIFESKPDAVPYNYRISYKIVQGKSVRNTLSKMKMLGISLKVM